MLKIIKHLKSGLVLSTITAISLGLSAGSVNAQEEDDDKDKEKERVVKIDCDESNDVEKVLDKYGFESKPLVLIIKGTCLSDEEGEENEVEVSRDRVSFQGDEVEGGYITGQFVVEGAREIGIAENMELDILSIERGQVSLEVEEEDGEIVIHVAVGLGDQATLDVITDASGASIDIDGPISIVNHSLLTVQQSASVGSVVIRGEISASLQSSLKISFASISDVSIKQDSHAYFAENVTPAEGTPEISCDSQSRVWGNIVGFSIGFDPVVSCEGY